MKGKQALVLYLLVIFAFVFAKAVLVPFSHDECQSYTIFAEHSSQGNTANNHWLNTWSAYPFYLLFGESELAMRLPNLLAFVFYLFYCFKFTQKFKSIEVQVLTAILLTAFPFMLDFFGMMRGYGMSLSFGLAALYHLIKLAENENDKKHLEKTLYFTLVALLANFTSLIFYAALALVVAYILIVRYKQALFTTHFKHLLLRPIIINAVVLSVAVYWVLFLKSHNQLYYGSELGLFKGTLQSLVMAFFYKATLPEGVTYLPWVWLFSTTILVAVVIGFFNKKKNYGYFSLALLVIVLCAIPILLNLFMGIKYPLDRGSLVFYAPMVVLLPYGLQWLMDKEKWIAFLSRVAIGVVVLVWGFNFAKGANLSYFCMWQYDAETDIAVKKIRNTSNDSVSIACNWLAEPAINFYIKKYNVLARKPAKIEDIGAKEFDYYYVFQNYHLQKTSQKIVLLQKFPVSEMILYTSKSKGDVLEK